ncbi:MAG: hypothetical protein ACREDJ_03730 [Methylocella sp.]
MTVKQGKAEAIAVKALLEQDEEGGRSAVQSFGQAAVASGDDGCARGGERGTIGGAARRSPRLFPAFADLHLADRAREKLCPPKASVTAFTLRAETP